MRTLAGLLAASLTPAALAQHLGDVALWLEGGRITTGSFTGTSTPPEPRRVFAAPLGINSPAYTEDPGFDCFPGTFPLGTALGFRVLKSLRAFDAGAAAYVTTPLSVDIEFGPLLRTTPPTDTVVQGFTLNVGSNGQWHRHLGYTLNAPATDGLYLLEMQLFSTSATIADSQPFWFVLAQNADPVAFANAERIARLTLAGDCYADVDDGSSTGTPDGGVGIEDLLHYLALFEAGSVLADMDDGSSTGTPDAGVGIEDLLYFLQRFEQGC